MGVLRWAGWLFAGVMAVSVVKCSMKQNEISQGISQRSSEEKARAARESRLNDARWHCKQFVTQQLRAPKSADFQNYRDFSAREMTDNVFLVGGYVDAQNAFGAVVRQNFICELLANADGSHWSGTKISVLPQ
jgi:hypothetical protein